MCRWAIVGQSCCAATDRAVRPVLRVQGASVNARAMADDQPAMSSGGTSDPVAPSVTMSRKPGMSDANTGRPAANASRTTSGNASHPCDGITTAAAFWSRYRLAAPSTRPTNRTRASCLRKAVSRSRCASRAPLPATTNCTSPDGATPPRLARIVSTPFRSASRPRNSTYRPGRMPSSRSAGRSAGNWNRPKSTPLGIACILPAPAPACKNPSVVKAPIVTSASATPSASRIRSRTTGLASSRLPAGRRLRGW